MLRSRIFPPFAIQQFPLSLRSATSAKVMFLGPMVPSAVLFSKDAFAVTLLAAAILRQPAKSNAAQSSATANFEVFFKQRMERLLIYIFRAASLKSSALLPTTFFSKRSSCAFLILSIVGCI